jgi:diacylglycerol kinase (ATP)
VSGIGLVFNPRAGANKRDPGAAKRLARQLGDHGVVAVPHSLDELSRAAEDFRRQNIEVLGIAGGDGTNHVTLTHFHDVYGAEPLPTVAFLRGGTMNTVANSLGLPKGRPEGLLDRLVRRYLETPKLQALDQRTMNIQGNLGFLWGLGVIPAFLTEYYNAGSPSPWTGFKTLSRAIGSSVVGGAMIKRMGRPIEVEMEFEGGERVERRPFFSVGAGTIADIGLGFRPFHLTSGAPGYFHMQAITTTPMGCVAELGRIHRAEPMRGGKAIDRLLRRLVVRTTEPTFRYMIDGDLLERPGPEMTIEVGPLVRIATMN